MNLPKRRQLSSWQFLTLGYLLIILLGSFLLSLPIASRAGTYTPYLSALFTATSATCVTGLAVVDTYLHWSLFGQLVLLVLIQVGGIGFMTVLTLVMLLLRKNVGLYQRQLIMQSAGNLNLSGSVALILRILRGTLLIEGIGAVLLSFRFCQDFGFWEGIYYGVFHAVSAFCNAGFDLMGRFGPFSSLSPYAGDPLVCLTAIALVLLGGLGFLVWTDLVKSRLRFRQFTLHTRIALVASAVLIIVPTGLFYFYEKDGLLAGLSPSQAWLRALFAAVTPRTAGFATIDMAHLSTGSVLLTTLLMFIGGNSGSTAGGIKITTFVVMLFSPIAGARRSSNLVIGGRQLDDSITKEAAATLSAYLLFAAAGCMVLAAGEPFSLTEILLEVVSAVATVGLSAGITASLTAVSQVTLILLMFAGRLGVMTLAIAFGERRNPPPLRRPTDRILIG